jgi:hypothetical protein
MFCSRIKTFSNFKLRKEPGVGCFCISVICNYEFVELKGIHSLAQDRPAVSSCEHGNVIDFHKSKGFFD